MRIESKNGIRMESVQFVRPKDFLTSFEMIVYSSSSSKFKAIVENNKVIAYFNGFNKIYDRRGLIMFNGGIDNSNLDLVLRKIKHKLLKCIEDMHRAGIKQRKEYPKPKLSLYGMITFLRNVYHNNKILQKLREVHLLSRGDQKSGILRILRQFEEDTGYIVLWVKQNDVVKLTSHKNYASLHIREKTLMIEEQIWETLDDLIIEVRHELCYYYTTSFNGTLPKLNLSNFNKHLLRELVEDSHRWMEEILEHGFPEAIKIKTGVLESIQKVPANKLHLHT